MTSRAFAFMLVLALLNGSAVAADKTPDASVAKAEFGGQCAEGLAVGRHVMTNCSVNWTDKDGKLYCFSNEAAKAGFLKDAPGISREMRREMIDGLSALNRRSFEAIGDPEIQTRTQQFEMAFRMQASVPELTDFSGENEKVYELYGSDAKERGTFANSALMARRLLERGVRFVQIFHRGWDQHGDLPRDLASQCKDVDQGCYGLIQDLKQRGMLDDTLVVWGGEFGRTIYCQGKLTEKDYGRDHHPRCFSIWLAGGGIKPGTVYGKTDEMSYNIAENPVHIRDLHATLLHQLGIDHEKLAFKYQGLDQRLTGVEPAHVVQDILA